MDDTNNSLLPLSQNDKLPGLTPTPPKQDTDVNLTTPPETENPNEPSPQEVTALATDFLSKIENEEKPTSTTVEPNPLETSTQSLPPTPPVLLDAKNEDSAPADDTFGNEPKDILNDLPPVSTIPTPPNLNDVPMMSSTPSLTTDTPPPTASPDLPHDEQTSFPNPASDPATPPSLAGFVPSPDPAPSFAPDRDPSLSDLPPSPPQVNITQTSAPASKLPKIIFTISLLIFLGVSGFLGYNLYLAANRPDTTAPETSQPEDQSVTPDAQGDENQDTPAAAGEGAGCVVNDKNYAFEETFPAEDGCNTCTCQTDGTIICTTNSCENTQETSINTTVEKLETAINQQLKSNLKFKSTTVEENSKQIEQYVLDLTKQNTKENITKIKNVLTSNKLAYQPDKSGDGGPASVEEYSNDTTICRLMISAVSGASSLSLTCLKA